MTILELARKEVLLYTRSGWETGQFVHAERMLMDHHGNGVKAVRTCWCSAPVPANDPVSDDDLWMAYEGPEATKIERGPALPGALFNSSIPVEVLAALAVLLPGGDPQREAVKQEMPDVPDWMITAEIRE